MANNIFTGPNGMVAKVTATFATIGFDETNVAAVIEIGTVPKSWVPGREINGIEGIEEGKSYYITALTAMDKSSFFAPPNGAATGGEVIQVFSSIPGGVFNTDYYAGDLVIL